MDETAIQSDPGPERPTQSQSHPLDTISLAFGAIFTILGAVFLFGDVDAETLSMAWAWSGLLGAVGLLLLAIGVKRHRGSEHHRGQGPDLNDA